MRKSIGIPLRVPVDPSSPYGLRRGKHNRPIEIAPIDPTGPRKPAPPCTAQPGPPAPVPRQIDDAAASPNCRAFRIWRRGEPRPDHLIRALGKFRGAFGSSAMPMRGPLGLPLRVPVGPSSPNGLRRGTHNRPTEPGRMGQGELCGAFGSNAEPMRKPIGIPHHAVSGLIAGTARASGASGDRSIRWLRGRKAHPRAEAAAGSGRRR